MLRPGGLFVWSATPVYQDLEEDVQIWNGKDLIFFHEKLACYLKWISSAAKMSSVAALIMS